jgi:hypothetical protein
MFDKISGKVKNIFKGNDERANVERAQMENRRARRAKLRGPFDNTAEGRKRRRAARIIRMAFRASVRGTVAAWPYGRAYSAAEWTPAERAARRVEYAKPRKRNKG